MRLHVFLFNWKHMLILVDDSIFLERVHMIVDRPAYLTRLDSLKDKHIIKVLTGVRRCGKSTIMELFRRHLSAGGVAPEQIHQYTFEDLDLSESQDYLSFYDTIKNSLAPGTMNYLFLDEIQQLKNFEKVVNSLFLMDNLDIYLTGSNGYMLSGELATLLSGRYIEIPVYPLSFKEFTSCDSNADTTFDRYQRYGSFPFTLSLDDEDSLQGYLEGVVNTVLVKDVLARKQRSNSVLVSGLASFLVDTSGSLITVKKISDTLTSAGLKTNPDTIMDYLQLLQDAFLFYRCDRYDVLGKRYLTVNSKYYPVDQGLRLALLGNKRPNMSSRLEGIVYLELRRRGYRVYVGTVPQGEVDFVAERGGVIEYYQVSASVENEDTYAREVSSFKAIRDNYRKVLLTRDAGTYNDNGIEQINVEEWLLSQ